MKTNENQTISTIYYRPLKQWLEVTPEQKRDWERFVGTTRKTKQRAGACCIPFKKSYKCDGLCDTCEFRCVPKDDPQHLSIDTEMENACENGVSRTSFLADNRLTTEIDIDSLILNGLLSELQASDPESYEMFQFYGANRTGRWAGRIIQMQNLPQNHLDDLSEARGLVRVGDFDALEMLYEDVPDTLSQLIRTAFVPQENRKFIVADFSAIEARVIAWLAGEKWRQDVFAEGSIKEEVLKKLCAEAMGLLSYKRAIRWISSQKRKRSTKARSRSTMWRATTKPSFSRRCLNWSNRNWSVENKVEAGTAASTFSPARYAADNAESGTVQRFGTPRINTAG